MYRNMYVMCMYHQHTCNYMHITYLAQFLMTSVVATLSLLHKFVWAGHIVKNEIFHKQEYNFSKLLYPMIYFGPARGISHTERG